jgi:hypothetical protein
MTQHKVIGWQMTKQGGGAFDTRRPGSQQYKGDRRPSLAVDHMTRGGVSQCKAQPAR